LGDEAMSFAPFTPADYGARIERAAAQAGDAGLSGLLVTPGPDLAYFTGYSPLSVNERLTLLVISASRDPAMIVPRLERGEAREAEGVTALALSDWSDGEDPYLAAAQLLDARGRYAVSDSAWAMHVLGLQEALPASRYVAMTQALPLLRAIKDRSELERLAAAAAAADASYEAIVGEPFAGRPEHEIGARLAALLREHGHSAVEFTVVGSGANGANPHHELSDRVIEAGDMVVLDFGGVRGGYFSDITRTVHVGAASPEEHAVYEVVRRAQQAGFEAARPGVACQDVDRAAREVISTAGYGEYFIHRTGHGIGLTVHEPPYLTEGEELPLAPGMCFSIEPGIYLPERFGVRIEDIVNVTDDGARRLNDAGHALCVVA
jgi:Xaa-Pro aminopeptidase